MRPTKLVVAGLHSYRDPVTVDFEELGRHGLFGIFGPIGSGKSTLLDAMTLALYGLVDRVITRSRQGLIHLGSQRCEVKLQFVIDASGRRQHYEVQRAYRLKDDTAQRTLSRLVEYTPTGPAVLADKERDVNQAVIELVGLGPEDFMRAVVLPQGKFLELLHLKGSERRQMLQRIFRLHAYGGRLRRQVSARQQATEQALASVQGELKGLGEATEASLAEARTAAEKALHERRAAQTAAEAARGEVVRTERLRAEHARLAEARRALLEHRSDAAAIGALEAQLAAAHAVASLTAPARHWNEARDHLRDLATAYADAERAAVECERGWAERRKAREVLVQTAAQQRPPLNQRLQELDALEKMVEARTAIDREIAEAKGQREDHETAIEAATTAWAQADARVAELGDKRRSVRRQLRRRRVKAAERERATVAAEAAERLDRAKAASRAARDAAEACRRRRGEAQAALEAAEAAGTAAQAALEAAALERSRLLAEPSADVDPTALRVAQAEHEATAQLQNGARARVERAQVAVHEALRSRDAATDGATEAQAAARQATAEARSDAARGLARTLVDATACPVCGGTDHPAPAAPPDPANPSFGGLDEPTGAVERHEAALSALASAKATLAAAEREHDAATRALAEVDTRAADLGSLEDVTRAIAHREAWSRAFDTATERWRKAELVARTADAPQQVAQVRLDDVDSALGAAESELEAARRAEAEAWDEFYDGRGDLTLFDVRNALIDIASRDREADALQRTLDDLDTTWQSAVQSRDARQLARDRAREQLLRLDERVSLLESRRASLVVPPLDLGAARAEVRAHLATIEATLAQADEAVEAMADRRRAADQRRASAEGQRDIAQRAERAAREALIAAVPSTLPWPDGTPPLDDDVLRTTVDGWLALADEVPKDAVMRVTRYRDAERDAMARLAALDDGSAPDPEALSDETWAAVQHAAEATRTALEAAVDRAVAAKAEVDAIAARRPRVEALQTRHTELDRELTQLNALAQVLRGDRFVEYVANDHLVELATRASDHLRVLTDGRYALSLDSDTGFEIVDHHGGGAVRPVHTLSGGESFLTALSLALALSTQVQARSARPLGFFFLDEGFGTLDPEALDRVLSSIEQLRDRERVIGLISHVPAVRERVPRYLWVHRSDDTAGSAVEMHDN